MISGTHTDLTITMGENSASQSSHALFCLITLCKGKTSDLHSSKPFPIYPDVTFIYYQTPNSLLNFLDCLERKKQSQVHGSVCFSPTKGPHKASTQTYLWQTDFHQQRETRQHGAFRVKNEINKVMLPLVNVKMNICLRSLSLTELSSEHVTQLWNSKQEPQLMKYPKLTSCFHKWVRDGRVLDDTELQYRGSTPKPRQQLPSGDVGEANQRSVDPYCSKYGPQTSSTHLTCESVRNAESQASPRTYRSRICIF